MRHLTRFRKDTVASGRQGDATWNAFAGIPCQVDDKRCYLELFHRKTVAGGKRGDATWNTFAKIPWQVDDKKCYLEHFRGNSVPGGRQGDATWNAFAGIPFQVEGKKCHLERFCEDSVPGGRQEVTPGTLLRGFRARWKQGDATWNAFAEIPYQVEAGRCHLERFRGDSVPGGLPISRDILWHSAGPSHNAGPFPSREPMPASASVCPCHPALF